MTASTDAARFAELFGGDRANGFKPDMRRADDSGKVVPAAPHRWTAPPSEELWADHLAGSLGLGVYAEGQDGRTLWGHLDVDDYEIVHAELVQRAEAQKLPVVVCRTKSGGARVFVFFAEPQPVADVRAMMRDVARVLGLVMKEDGGKTEVVTGNVWMPYQGGSECVGIKPTGIPMEAGEFLRSAFEKRLSQEQWEDLRAKLARAPRQALNGANGGDHAGYAALRLKQYCEELAATPDGGGRNKLLNTAFYVGGTMAGARWIDRETVAEELTRVADSIGMDRSKTRAMANRSNGPLARGMLVPPREPANAKREEPIIVRMSDVAAREISWLWANRFAVGKLSLIIGNPGLGKSQISIFMATQVTRGGPWPNGEGRAPLGNVIMLSAEDDAADTIRPRLDAAGADVNRVWLLEAIKTGDNGRRGFNLTTDIERLEGVIDQVGDVKLIIVDPISAYLGGKMDSHRTTDVRAALAPLQDLAARRGVAVVAITHMAKNASGNAVTRAIGSIAFAAAARAVFLVVQPEESDDEDGDGPQLEPGQKLFVCAKNNIGPDGDTGLVFKIVKEADASATVVQWEGTTDLTADQALAPAAKSGGRGAGVKTAMSFLSAALRDGPRLANEVRAEAEREGINEKALRKAAERLAVEKVGAGPGKPWTWHLPGRGQIAMPLGGEAF